MLYKRGFTLLEMIVVLVIIAVAAVFAFPNFSTPTEQARALTARNNLLAIYSAEQNYSNNHGGYCIAGCDSLLHINTTLSLNIQDDGTFNYVCTSFSSGFYCTAQRTTVDTFSLKATLNAPIELHQSDSAPNPYCDASNTYSNWCPYSS